MLIFYHMNYLNPYIALGGRNPFRACLTTSLQKNCQNDVKLLET